MTVTISAQDAAHLLRRSGFGVDPDELQSLMQCTDRREAVDRVLSVENAPPLGLPTVSDTSLYGDWWKAVVWWMERMRTSPVGIVEKMTLFWHDHFVSSTIKCLSIELAMTQHQVFRRHGLGDFETLTQEIAVDPNMLIYLDNWLNVSWGPQENFARELLELFTVGIGNFDENDVAELSRAWTGHGLSSDYRSYQYHGWAHDAGDKSLFGLPARNWNGPETITEIVRGVKADATSKFIAAKVFSYLAYPVQPDDAPVEAIAARFRAADMNIAELVRAVFESDEFWSARARFALVRSPIEWLVAALRVLDVPAGSGLTSNDMWALGQVPFGHPHVAGWGSNEDWVSTGATWSRADWVSRVRWLSFFVTRVFADLQSAAPVDVAAEAFRRFGIVDPSDHTRSVVENWASRMRAEGQAAAIPFNLPMVLLLSPEFQVS